MWLYPHSTLIFSSWQLAAEKNSIISKLEILLEGGTLPNGEEIEGLKPRRKNGLKVQKAHVQFLEELIAKLKNQ